MKVQNATILEEVTAITYNGEPVPKEELTNPDGKYYQKYYTSSLSEAGIKQIGKIVRSFEIYIDEAGWFRCEC